MNLQHKTMLAVAEIAELYMDETDKKPWVIAWSGGKDSTTVLKLVAQAVKVIPKEKRKREIYCVMSDTQMENPELERYMHEQVRLVNEWAKREEVPLSAHTVSRGIEKSFFYLVLGRGYPLPNNQTARWCTHKLKIEPQNVFIKEVDPSLVFLGVRTDESTRRAQSIERYREEKDSRFGSHYNLPEIRTYMPIVHFSTEEIWELLMMPLPWGSSEDIRKLYREATGECVLVNMQGVDEKAKEMASCDARFGCWTCPPIRKDKSTENMATVHGWMGPLTVWRKQLVEEYKKPENKAGYMRNGKYLGEGKGTLTVAARQRLMASLLQTQNTMNELRADEGLPPIELLKDEEVQMIYAQWKEDVEKTPWIVDDTINEKDVEVI